METQTAGLSAGPPAKKGIAGSTLKLIAIITMLIDHTGAIVMERQLTSWWNIWNGKSSARDMAAASRYNTLFCIYWFSRNVLGRIAFPIFCFLLVEGFVHTRNPKKYAERLFLFALVSEVPFDLGIYGSVWTWQGQNVFFTLFLGLLVIAGFRLTEGKDNWSWLTCFACRMAILGAGMGAALLLKTDYNMYGVLAIAVMYTLRWNRLLEAGAGCAVLVIMSSSELCAFLAVIPLVLYDGRRGWNVKWLFYLFYPLHIALLYLTARALLIT